MATRLAGMACVLAFLALAGAAGWAQPGPNAVVVLRTDSTAGMEGVIAEINAAGGHIRHIFPPHVLIGAVPPAARTVLGDDPRVLFASSYYVSPAAVPESYGRTARDAINAWNDVFVTKARTPRGLAAGKGKPLLGDARRAPLPPEPLFAPSAPERAYAPPGAQYWQLSEYMMGRVSVSFILLESSGATDPSTENWTTTEESQVTSECVAGLEWWASIYPYSVADLSFTYTWNYRVPTGYEPINRSSNDEGLWMAQALTTLGWSCTKNTYFDTCRQYCNNLRNTQGTDWAFAVFIVDSSADADGCFTDGYFAYAYIGGPLVVLTYDNDGWGIADMNSVLAHETGHIFQAGDEYCQPGYSCCDATDYYGYLMVQNTGCGTGIACVMNDNSPTVCSVSRQQIGWRDTNTDSVPDILDVNPTLNLNAYSPDPTTNGTITMTGMAAIGYYPNQQYSGYNVTLNRVSNVFFRVDGGTWQDGTASDGAFDEGLEAYTFTTTLAPGTHTVEVKARDTSGNESLAPYPSDTITVQSTVDHFAVSISPAPPEPQGADATHPLAFTLQAQARTAGDTLASGYAGTPTLSASAGTVSPTSLTFSGGNYSGSVTMAATAAGDVVLTVTDAGLAASGSSASIPLRLKGDANGDAIVNVLDVLRTVNLALGATVSTPPRLEFQTWAANMNNDAMVDVLDVLQVVNRSLGTTAPPAGAPPAAAKPAQVRLVRRSAMTWALTVSGVTGLAGLQAEILLPAGGSAAAALGRLTQSAGWQLHTASAANSLRLVAYQPQAQACPGEGDIVLVTVPKGAKPRLASIMLADRWGRPLPVR